MKRVLITGANSYIGTSLEKWLQCSLEAYHIDTLDMKNPNWAQSDFSNYDTVFHVAAIVHQNEKQLNPEIYDKVNRDLPYAVAQKAKSEGVSQFIFLSTMSVYSGEEEHITGETKENPVTFYGKSKLEAEKLLNKLQSAVFKLVILRPPMVYGSHATGNYARLSKLSKYTPFFPSVDNQRSMIYIDNLCEFVRQAIDREISGVYFPQNKEYVNTSVMVKEIRNTSGKKTMLTSLFNPIIKAIGKKGQLKKVFGTLVYDQAMSQYDFDYNVVDFATSIEKSEKK